MPRDLAAKRRLPVVLRVLALLCGAAIVGCGPGSLEEYDKTTEGQIGDVVEHVPGAAGTTEKGAWEEKFAAGSAPENREDFATFHLRVKKGSVSQSGNSATAIVIVEDKTETVVGELEWEFVKESDSWKVSKSKLPPQPKAP